ncbi:MAG TPA: tRNA pseudouridine(13) synthase TruD [Candidatus Aenigmarchaeota archaeon]|nr:tRNA pseudouridine(13) synthase TruD [Candidatus Aenigmarchaeota archaeon]
MAIESLEILKKKGVPNYYEEQRFGINKKII